MVRFRSIAIDNKTTEDYKNMKTEEVISNIIKDMNNKNSCRFETDRLYFEIGNYNSLCVNITLLDSDIVHKTIIKKDSETIEDFISIVLTFINISDKEIALDIVENMIKNNYLKAVEDFKEINKSRLTKKAIDKKYNKLEEMSNYYEKFLKDKTANDFKSVEDIKIISDNYYEIRANTYFNR